MKNLATGLMTSQTPPPFLNCLFLEVCRQQIRTKACAPEPRAMPALGRWNPYWRIAMSMKQLETFMSRVQSNDSLRDEVQRCGKDNSCVVKVGAKHGHKFSPALLTRWQREH